MEGGFPKEREAEGRLTHEIGKRAPLTLFTLHAAMT